MEIFLTILGVSILFFGEYVYIREIIGGGNKPHPFSWLGWSLLTGIIAVVQIYDNSGWASGILFAEAVVAFLIFLLSLKYGEKKIYKSDWASLFLGLIAVVLWSYTKTPLYSVLLITLADFLMFIPTIKKTFYNPFEEELIEYYTSNISYILSFFAVAKITFISFFYPGTLIVINSIFIIVTLLRRKQINLIKK